MKIVIANAPCYLDNGKGVILFPSRWDSAVVGKPLFHFFPYQLALLSSLLKRELPDAHVELVDGNLYGWDGDRYALELRRRKPDVLICELSALTYSTMTRVMQRAGARENILCGPMAHPDFLYQTHLAGWSHRVSGEYEHKVLSLLKGANATAGLLDNGYIDLDWLPWPEDEDVPRIAYQEINHYRPGIVQLYATRGCPLACTFCVVPTYYGGHGHSHRSHRCRDVDNVCEEIKYLARKYPEFGGCYFNEEAHNANPEWLAEFCAALVRHGLNRYHFDAMCGMWPFTKDLVELCAYAGYKQIRVGVESTSEQVGKAIKKTLHKEKTETFLGWLKDFGIKAYITLQVGAMGSTEESDRATLEDAREWIRKGWVQRWQLSTSTPQVGTPFFNLCKENGWLVTENLDDFDGYKAVVNYPDYPAERIAAVRQGAGL